MLKVGIHQRGRKSLLKILKLKHCGKQRQMGEHIAGMGLR